MRKPRITWRGFSLFRVIVYVILLPTAVITGWLTSVAFVSVLSVVALIEAAISAWRSDVPNEEEG